MFGKKFLETVRRVPFNTRSYGAGSSERSNIFSLIALSFSSLCLGVVSYLQNKEIDELKGKVKGLEEARNRAVHWSDIEQLDTRVENLENKNKSRGC